MNATLEPAVDAAIDWSKSFMPEQLTHLYHTPVWSGLTDDQRLRYAQLHALYINEQILFFERAFAPNVLDAFLADPSAAHLHSGLRTFREEEEQHSAMFWDLNRKCMPQWYANSYYHFIQVPNSGRRFLNFITRHPRWFPLCLWLMLLQEDRALHYGRTYLRHPDLEPHFHAVHKRHLADEAGHVRWDEQLINLVWPNTRPPVRRMNVALCSWMVSEFFSTPKRAGIRIIDEWTRESAALARKRLEIHSAVRELKNDRAFHKLLYGRSVVPAAFAQLDRWHDLAPLARSLEL
jgi:hypothetical protein